MSQTFGDMSDIGTQQIRSRSLFPEFETTSDAQSHLYGEKWWRSLWSRQRNRRPSHQFTTFAGETHSSSRLVYRMARILSPVERNEYSGMECRAYHEGGRGGAEKVYRSTSSSSTKNNSPKYELLLLTNCQARFIALNYGGKTPIKRYLVEFDMLIQNFLTASESDDFSRRSR